MNTLSDDWRRKNDFIAFHGISLRTCDRLVREGKAEKILDGRTPYFRMRAAPPGDAPTQAIIAPEGARMVAELIEELRALRAEIASLRAAQGAPDGAAPDAPWWETYRLTRRKR